MTKPSSNGFLIMPFGTELDWLRDDIVAAGEAAGVTITRADSIFTPGILLDQILESIDQAAVVVGITTGRNPNVFFELGYAWRSHKPVLLAEGTADLPFDVAHYRTLIYGTPTPNLDREKLRNEISHAIAGAKAERPLPRGQRLNPPARKSEARLTADLQETGGGSRRLVVANTGMVPLHNVDVVVPADVTSFNMHASDVLPIDLLRPSERVKLPALTMMGGGRQIFDIELRGTDAEGNALSFPVKISLF